MRNICKEHERQQGAVTLLASPGEGGVAGSTARTFSKFSPNTAVCGPGAGSEGLGRRFVTVLTPLLADL